MNKGNYEFVPAGMYFPNHSGLAIYTRYHKRHDRPARLIETCSTYDRVDLPDRELVLTSAAHNASSYYPSQGTFDECAVLSPFYPGVASAYGIGHYMVNYTQHINKQDRGHNTRRSGNYFPEGETKIIADSGGYQLLSEGLNYLDPAKIVSWYNDNVDIGLVLDIPTGVWYEDLYERLAKIQKKNTDVMIQGARKGLELMNIFHGTNPRERKIYRDICEVDGIDRLAIGGFYYKNIMTSIDLLYDTLHSGKSYKHYHILGIANILQVIPIMRMAHHEKGMLITSDASTHIQESANKGYHMFSHVSEEPTFIQIGDKSHLPSNFNELPCNCPVCSSIRYMDVLSVLNNNRSCFLLMYHNMYSMNKYFKTMWDLMSTASLKDIKALFKTQLSGSRRRGVAESIHSLDFIDHLYQEGPVSARKKYSYYISGSIFKEKWQHGLIKNEAAEQAAEEERKAKSATEKRLETILTNYEKGTGVHGDKNKSKNFRGNKTVVSTGKKKLSKLLKSKMHIKQLAFKPKAKELEGVSCTVELRYDNRFKPHSQVETAVGATFARMEAYLVAKGNNLNQTTMRKMMTASTLNISSIKGAVIRKRVFKDSMVFFVRAKKKIENIEIRYAFKVPKPAASIVVHV